MIPDCKLKEYLYVLEPDEAHTILRARLGMTEVKANYKNKFKEINCKNCGETEDLKHLLTCNETEEIVNFAENLKNILWTEAENPRINIENLKNLAQLITRKVIFQNLKLRTEASPPDTTVTVTSQEDGHHLRF